MHLGVQRFVFCRQIRRGLADLLFFPLQTADIQLARILLQTRLLAFLAHAGQRFLRLLQERLVGRYVFLHLLHGYQGLFACFLQLLDLPFPAQQIAAVFKRASGHGAPGIEQLPVQCHDPQRIAVFSGQGNGMVDLIHYHHAPQQIPDQRPVLRIRRHQIACKAQDAGLPKRRRLPERGALCHAAKRQEGGPPIAVFL